MAHYAPFFPALPGGAAEIGGFGVSIFFGISGLLICTLLLREREERGRIDLRSFFLRRAFRILPVAWLFIMTVALFRQRAGLIAPAKDLWAAAFFLRNYVGANVGTTQHFWSLAIEEHFYLILPIALAFFGPKRTRNFCVAVVAAVCVWRDFVAIDSIGDPGNSLYRTDMRIDALFDGALCALLLRDDRVQGALIRSGPWAIYCAALGGIVGSRLVHSLTLSRSLLALAIPAALLPGILFPDIWTARVLEMPWLRWLGRLSYSAYIWQGLFTSNQLHLLWGEEHRYFNLLAMCGVSIASYYLLERPIIRWGHRALKPAISPRADPLEPAGLKTPGCNPSPLTP